MKGSIEKNVSKNRMIKSRISPLSGREQVEWNERNDGLKRQKQKKAKRDMKKYTKPLFLSCFPPFLCLFSHFLSAL